MPECREAEMRELSETTNARIAWLSIMSLGVCLGVSAWQLWHLKHYFQKKKIVWSTVIIFSWCEIFFFLFVIRKFSTVGKILCNIQFQALWKQKGRIWSYFQTSLLPLIQFVQSVFTRQIWTLLIFF